MKIVMLGTKWLPYSSGIESVVEKIGTRLVAKGHEVVAYVRPHYASGSSASQTEYRGITLRKMPCIKSKNFEALSATLIASVDAALRNADIVHIHSIGLSVFSPIARARGIKTIVQSHGLDWKREKWGPIMRRYLQVADRASISFPDRTIVVSKCLQDDYINRFNREAIYIPNGVDLPLRGTESEIGHNEIVKLGLTPNEYILFASRLVPEKGCHKLIQAFAQTTTLKKLVIAGDVNYRDAYYRSLKEMAKRDNRVIFVGFATGLVLKQLYANCYLYSLPSSVEGMSVGLLEAMSFKCCVLVSDIEENVEVVGNGGAYFKTEDVICLRDRLRELLSDTQLNHRLRAMAFSKVSSHPSWDQVTDEYERLYFDLVGNRSS